MPNDVRIASPKSLRLGGIDGHLNLAACGCDASQRVGAEPHFLKRSTWAARSQTNIEDAAVRLLPTA